MGIIQALLGPDEIPADHGRRPHPADAHADREPHGTPSRRDDVVPNRLRHAAVATRGPRRRRPARAAGSHDAVGVQTLGHDPVRTAEATPAGRPRCEAAPPIESQPTVGALRAVRDSRPAPAVRRRDAPRRRRPPSPLAIAVTCPPAAQRRPGIAEAAATRLGPKAYSAILAVLTL